MPETTYILPFAQVEGIRDISWTRLSAKGSILVPFERDMLLPFFFFFFVYSFLPYFFSFFFPYIYMSLVCKYTGSVCTHTILLNSRLHRVCCPRTLPTFGTAITNHRKMSHKSFMILSILYQTLIQKEVSISC